MTAGSDERREVREGEEGKTKDRREAIKASSTETSLMKVLSV